jgi:tripartite-type tricarboxylate transporter receptor subunit TctC
MLPKFPIALLLLLIVIAPSLAQTVTVVVPTGAGAAPDLLARKLGQDLAPRLGGSFVVENRPGAAGMIGATTVARSSPDGHTLLLAWDGMMAINPSLYPQINYNPQTDFLPIAALGRVEFVLVAHPSFAPNTLAELIAAAKAAPAKFNYGSAGVGEVHHIAMEALAAQAGIQLTHVPYKGGPAELNDIMGGHVPFGFIGLTPALPLLKSGNIKAIAVLGRRRSEHLPAVPTVAEALPGYSIEGSWLGLFAPAGTPSEVVQRLNSETNKLIKERQFIDFMVGQGMVPMELSVSQFAELIRSDTARFRDIITKLGIHIN